MVRYTQEQRLQIVQLFYKNNRSPIATFRALLPFYGRNNRPPVLAIRRIVANYERTSSLQNVQVPIKQRTARSNENIAAVRASVVEDRSLSIPRRCKQLGLSQTTTWRILKKDLGLHPLKKGGYKDVDFGDSANEHVPDAYLVRVKAEASEKDSEDDDKGSEEESTAEDFNPTGDVPDVAEEFDSNPASDWDASCGVGKGSGGESAVAEKKRKKKHKEEKKEKKERTKKSNKNKESNKPKPATTAFIFWLNDTREKIKSENPGIKLTEMAKKAGEMWRELEDKTIWEEKAAKDKQRYSDEMENYKPAPEESDDDKEGGDSKSQANASSKKRKKESVYISEDDSSSDEGDKKKKGGNKSDSDSEPEKKKSKSNDNSKSNDKKTEEKKKKR